MEPGQKAFRSATREYHGKVFNNLHHQYVLVANRQIYGKAEMTGAEAKLKNSELLLAFKNSIGADGKGTIPLARWCIARDAGNNETNSTP